MVNLYLEGDNFHFDSLDQNAQHAWRLLVDVREMIHTGMNDNQKNLWFGLLDQMCHMWSMCEANGLHPFKDEDAMIWTVTATHSAMSLLEQMQ